jgi:hypothetical protein
MNNLGLFMQSLICAKPFKADVPNRELITEGVASVVSSATKNA